MHRKTSSVYIYIYIFIYIYVTTVRGEQHQFALIQENCRREEQTAFTAFGEFAFCIGVIFICICISCMVEYLPVQNCGDLIELQMARIMDLKFNRVEIARYC